MLSKIILKELIMFKKILRQFLKLFFTDIYNERYINHPVYAKHYLFQKLFGINRKAYWPMDWKSKVSGSEYILVGVGSAPGYSQGCYIVASEKSPINIGNYTFIAPNVIMPGRNHNIYNIKIHDDGGIKIGNYCWVGANSVILPNVELGDHTIVGAGSVVTKSFKEGYTVIAGNPAKPIKYLNKEECVEINDTHEYHGFIKKSNFKSFREKKLKI